MGSFFSNVHVRAKDPGPVVDDLRPKLRGSGALVSPERGGWITVYPESGEQQDFSILQSLGQHLSRQRETVVYATMVHDGDVLMYYLADNGRRVDEYNSRPDYFGPCDPDERQQFRGDATVFLRYCASGTTLRQVEGILHPNFLAQLIARLNPLKWIEPGQTVAALLARCLGISRNRALCGYRYASRGELGEDMRGWSEVG